MKKIILAVMLIMTIFMNACAPSSSKTSESTAPTHINTTTETQDTLQTDTVQTTAPTELTAEMIYDDFLGKLCVRLNKIIVDDTYLDGLNTEEGMAGIAEMAYHVGVDLLDQYGYTFFDINGDNVAELIICSVNELTSESCIGTDILCVFTVADSEMKLLVEGWSRNSYHILDDGSIFRVASNGAAYSTYATYMINQNNDVVCTDCYFTDLDDQEQPLYLHNTTGENDPAKSEPVDGGEKAFLSIVEGFSSKIRNIDLNPLSAFEG